MYIKENTRMLNIGLMLGDLDETYHNMVWPNFIKAAKNLNINLFLIVGKQLASPMYEDKEQNIVYSLITKKKFDGLIFFSGTLGHYVDFKEIELFAGQYKDIPAVGINQNIKGIPNVLMNSKKGQEELIEHLINVHGYTKFAFIQGPAGHQAAAARYNAFIETLEKHNILIDPELISTHGNFLMESGELSVKQFLKTKKKIDVIVCANDEMAIGAINELKRNNFEVPRDIAVTGFDKTDESVFTSPSLTTVKQPYYELCEKAIDLLAGIINGKKVQQNIEVYTKLEINHSCGCCMPGIKKIKKINSMRNFNFSGSYTIIEKNKKSIISNTLSSVNISKNLKQHILKWLEGIIDEIIDVIKNNKPVDSLFYSITEFNNNFIFDFNDYDLLKDTLSLFFLNCFNYMKENNNDVFENITETGKILIDEIMLKNKALESVYLRKYFRKLQTSGQYIITSFNMEMLTDRLEQELSVFDINSCFIALYDNNAVEKKSTYHWHIPQHSRLIFALKSGKRIRLKENEVRFETFNLLPDNIFKKIKNTNMILMPILYKSEHFGFILFEFGSIKNLIYESIRAQISTAIKKEKDHKKDKYSALGMLFSGISHEILNPLGGVFAPLENLKICIEENYPGNNEKINSYFNRMENNLLRIENIVKGLKALHHDRILTKSNLNLLEIVNIAVNIVKNSLTPGIKLLINIPEDAVINTNQQAFIIIVQNLLKNAIDAIHENGVIEIKLEQKYQTPCLVIKDTGIGISEKNIDYIFNAFFTTKEVGKGTGLGLYLVKDLITRMKWEINVNSQENKGTEFRIKIKSFS